MKSNKRGSINAKSIEVYIFGFILVVVLFKVIASLFPTVTSAGDDLNASGFPLAEFFTADGILWYLVAAGLLIMLYKSFAGNMKK